MNDIDLPPGGSKNSKVINLVPYLKLRVAANSCGSHRVHLDCARTGANGSPHNHQAGYIDSRLMYFN